MTGFFSNGTIAAAGYLGVLSVLVGVGANNAVFIGLALVWSLEFSTLISPTLKLLADTESSMNAVVRLYDYIDNNPAEKDFDKPPPQKRNWPTHGNLKIDSVSYKYRP